MQNAVNQYLVHYHAERPHQGLGNKLIKPVKQTLTPGIKVDTIVRLGGLLRSFRRAAA